MDRSRPCASSPCPPQDASGCSKIPADSPQLNPDEWVWNNVKHGRVGRAGVSGPDQFKALAVAALHRLQTMPRIVRGFFSAPNLTYIVKAA